MRHSRDGQAPTGAQGISIYALRAALKPSVQRLAHSTDKPADSHEIIDFGSPAVISGKHVVCYSG